MHLACEGRMYHSLQVISTKDEIMKIIIKNFLSVLRRFKMAALLNVFGLSIAFAAFMIIMMQVDYDQNFDRMHPHSDTIYRVEIDQGKEAQAIISRPMADAFIQSSPHILAGTLCNPWHGDIFFTVEENGNRNSYNENALAVYPEYVKVFAFDMIEGKAEALGEPNKVLLPLSLSRKFFGNESAVGKLLKTRNNTFTVGAVYRDFPRNSSVSNSVFYAIGKDENLHNWGNWNYIFYVRLDAPESSKDLVDNFKKHFDATAIDKDFSWEKAGFDIRLTALPEVHYITNVKYDSTPKSSRQTLMVLFAIAIVIVVIAAINFTNFSTALTPMRIKSINTQKVLGSEERTIRLSIIMEAVLISSFSYLLALAWIGILQFTPLAALINADITIAAHPLLVSGTALMVVITGILAGVYPAYYMTSFPPALVLKGSFGLSSSGRVLRNILISIQFIASFSLIIGALFMYLQNYYMQHSSLGYDKDEVIVTNINNVVNKSREAFTNQLKSFSGVEDVTYAEPLLSSQDQYMGWGRMYHDKNINYQCLPVDASFLKVMGVDILEGRDFRKDDERTSYGVYVFNQRAKEEYDLSLGDMIDSTEIVGFMPNVKFASFRTEVTPMAFYVWGTQNWGSQPNYAYIKVKAGSDMRGAIEHVRSSLHTFDAEYPFDVRFFDAVMNQLYEKEKSLSSLITLFSLIAVFISIVGVFGLVVFDSEYRKREISVRKVLGSTTGQILIMFNKTYLMILGACFAIAAPMAWYAVYRWLENFAYKTPMYWWVYPIALVVVGVITILTVTFQNWRAANENPVNSMKNE